MDAQLLALPCGCVVDAEVRLTYYHGNADCPWCSATFRVDEWVRWLAQEDREPLVVAPKPLEVVRIGDRVLERLGSCDCGFHRVRSCDRDGEPEFHLSVPSDALETLRN